MASRAYISARTSIFRTTGGPLSRKSHYSSSEVFACEALLKTLRPWSALSLVRVKRSLGALIRRLVRTGSSPASRYSVVKRGILLSLHLYSFSGRSGAYFYAFAEKFLRYFLFSSRSPPFRARQWYARRHHDGRSRGPTGHRGAP